MKKDPIIFAVILNYNGYEDSIKCIESFKKMKNKSIRLIVVDNASTDDSGVKLKDKYPEFHFIFSNKNRGYAAGMNLGIKYVLDNNADFILIVNNDTVVSEDFLEPMLNEMDDDNVGIVSGKVYYRENPNVIYCAGGRVDYLRGAGVAEFQGEKGEKFANARREISLAEGCFMMVRKEVFNTIGLFEEKYFMYFEDLDFSLRVRKLYKIIYNNNSVIYHKSGAGKAWEEFTPLYSYYYTRNRLWFFQNYSFIYRIYIVFISIQISLLKSLKMLLYFIDSPKKRIKILKSLTSLWRGTKDGIFLIMHKKKELKS